jgi:2-polyprenyl-3-methyl-5-hydroxy-6-metoxy-1,4-benzoquinol methylase
VIDEAIYNRAYFEKYLKYNRSAINGPIQEARWGVVRKHAPSGTLLDIGCSVGSFLEKASSDYQVEGREINTHCIEHCNGMGIKVHAELPVQGRFDIITMFDVLEHMPYLEAMLESIWLMLKSGGIWVVATPDFHCAKLDHIDDWKHYRPTEHVWCLSESSMRAIAQRMGFQLLEINFDESEYRPPKDNIATYVFKG